MMKLGDFLWAYLYRRGIRHCFGLPGDYVLPLFAALEQSPIELLTFAHEPGSGFAADAYARLRGLSVACVTYNVGGLNMLNSIAGAWAEMSPVLVISGGPPRSYRISDVHVHHKVRDFSLQQHIFAAVTCASAVLLDAETAAEEIVRVVTQVEQQRRPGYIEIPADMVHAQIAIPDEGSPQRVEHASLTTDELEACMVACIEQLNAAQRPVLILGVEMWRYDLAHTMVGFAERHAIPFATTLLSKGLVAETHLLFLGVYSGALSTPSCAEYVRQSDCVLLLGVIESDIFCGLTPAGKIAPDRGIRASVAGTSVDTRRFANVSLPRLVEALAATPLHRYIQMPQPHNVKLVETPLHRRAQMPQPRKGRTDVSAAAADTPLSVARFFALLNEYLDDQTILVVDVGEALFGSIDLMIHRDKGFLSSSYYTTMGFAVPAALGALKAVPECRVIALVGDGSFHMTGMELSTAARYQLAPVIVVLNNAGYGTQRLILDGDFNHIHSWHYTKVCEVLGAGKAWIAYSVHTLTTAMQAALSADTWTLIEVILSPDDYSIALQRVGRAIAHERLSALLEQNAHG